MMAVDVWSKTVTKMNGNSDCFEEEIKGIYCLM